jgi:hypothetical protein
MPLPTLPILESVTGIVRDVLRRVLPRERMSEAEAAAVEEAAMQALRSADWREVEAAYADRADARSLAKADVAVGNAWTGALAAIHRPIWSLGVFVLFAWALVSPQLGLPNIDLTEVHKDVMMTVIVFYFGGRTVEKVTATVRQARAQA